MTTPVSFKLAKLLKEKGYNTLQVVGDFPTIAEVVMWLYEEHGIWIEVVLESSFFTYDITTIKNGENLVTKYYNFNSPTEAYESGIEYCLTNLI
jgi:hypothetical protein